MNALRRLTADDIRSFKENGFVVLRNVLDAPHRAALLDECMQIWREDKSSFDPDATWLQNALVRDIHHRSTLVRHYYFEGPLVDVAEQLIGPNIKGATSQLTFKMRGNTQSFGWHQDNGYGQLDPANAISTLTALDDADEENGCLSIIPGSHHQGQIDVTDRLTAESKAAGSDLSVEVSKPDDAIPLSMNAGDAIVLHCHVLHRSEGNRSTTRDRRILFMRYADADAVEVYNERRPRLGPLLRGITRFSEVADFER
jgi:hypothetical protein